MGVHFISESSYATRPSIVQADIGVTLTYSWDYAKLKNLPTLISTNAPKHKSYSSIFFLPQKQSIEAFEQSLKSLLKSISDNSLSVVSLWFSDEIINYIGDSIFWKFVHDTLATENNTFYIVVTIDHEETVWNLFFRELNVDFEISYALYCSLGTSPDFSESIWKKTSITSSDTKDDSPLSKLIDSIEEIDISDPFTTLFQNLIYTKNLSRREIADKMNISPGTLTNIFNGKSGVGKRMLLGLCIVMELSIREAEDLMASAGYTFSPANLTDMIVKAALRSSIYDLSVIDEVLIYKGEPPFLKL